MKLFSKQIILSVAVIAITFASCKKDQVGSDYPNTNNTGITAGFDPISTGPLTLAPKLKKHGERVLTYSTDGRLNNVVFNSSYQTAYSIENQRTYSTHIATNYSQGTISGRFLYRLNSNGLAMSIRAEKLSGGEWSLSWEDDYIYNSSKQLIKISNESGHYDFVYDANDDLTSITYTNWQNKVVMETNFWYGVAGTLIDDKNRINPEDQWFDTYLKIYGRFRKHLPKRIKYSNYLPGGEKSDFRFDYILNADGYIKSQNKYYTLTNTLVETKAFEY